MIKDGLIFTEPEARLIWRGLKTLIIKDKKHDVINTPLLLLGQQKAYGVITVKNINQISLDSFSNLRKYHFITEGEREYRWRDRKRLFAYEFDFNPYKEPKDYVKKYSSSVPVKNIVLETETSTPKTIEKKIIELFKAEVPYTIQQMKWTEQKTFRNIPTFRWYLMLDVAGEVRTWELRDNPLINKSTVAVYQGESDRKWLQYSGTLKSGDFQFTKSKVEGELKPLIFGTTYLTVEKLNNKEVLTLKNEKIGEWKMTQEETNTSAYKLTKETTPKNEGTFTLHKNIWFGGKYYNIKIDAEENALLEWSLKNCPILMKADNEGKMLTQPKPCLDKSWMSAEGRRKVGGVSIDVKILDQGSVEIVESTDQLKTFIFKGEALKGKYVLSKEKNKWFFTKSTQIEKQGDLLLKPFAGYKDFADCVKRNKNKKGIKDVNAYCGWLKHRFEKAEEEYLAQQ